MNKLQKAVRIRNEKFFVIFWDVNFYFWEQLDDLENLSLVFLVDHWCLQLKPNSVSEEDVFRTNTQNQIFNSNALFLRQIFSEEMREYLRQVKLKITP